MAVLDQDHLLYLFYRFNDNRNGLLNVHCLGFSCNRYCHCCCNLRRPEFQEVNPCIQFPQPRHIRPLTFLYLHYCHTREITTQYNPWVESNLLLCLIWVELTARLKFWPGIHHHWSCGENSLRRRKGSRLAFSTSMSSAPEAPFSVWFWLQTQISIRPPVKTHTHGNNQIKITSKLAHTILQVKFKLILHLQIKTQRNFILLHFGCKRQASHSQQLCHPSFTFLQIYATATDKIRNRNIAKKKN